MQGVCQIREFREKSEKCVVPKNYKGKSGNLTNSGDNLEISGKLFALFLL